MFATRPITFYPTSTEKMSLQIGIEIGHTPAEPGAAHRDTHLSEFDFNQTLARAIAGRLQDPVEVTARDRSDPTGRKLPEKLNQEGHDVVIALHCNAYKGSASGCETLYWKGANRSRFLAEELVERYHEALGNPNRGARPRNWSSDNTRGARFLSKTRMPYVLCEPFFVDEGRDLRRAQSNFCGLVQANVNALKRFRERFG